MHDILPVGSGRQAQQLLLGHIGQIGSFGDEMELGNIKINNFRTFIVVVFSYNISSFLACWKSTYGGV